MHLLFLVDPVYIPHILIQISLATFLNNRQTFCADSANIMDFVLVNIFKGGKIQNVYLLLRKIERLI